MATYSRVFNFKPDLNGYSQTWKRATSVFSSEDGSRKNMNRVQLMNTTKMEVSLSVAPIKEIDNQRLENLVRLIFTEDNGIVGVPLWFSASTLSAHASTGSASITIGITSNGEYANPSGGYRDIMISLGDYNPAFSSTVSNISGGTLTLGGAPNLNYRSGTTVTPIIGMKINNLYKTSYSRYNARGTSYNFEFEEID